MQEFSAAWYVSGVHKHRWVFTSLQSLPDDGLACGVTPGEKMDTHVRCGLKSGRTPPFPQLLSHQTTPAGLRKTAVKL
jgi:hypothetical protein